MRKRSRLLFALGRRARPSRSQQHSRLAAEPLHASSKSELAPGDHANNKKPSDYRSSLACTSFRPGAHLPAGERLVRLITPTDDDRVK